MPPSALSSPGTNATWLAELVRSMCGPRPSPSAIEVVYPTQAQVGCSLEGWVAGTSIPCDVNNAEREWDLHTRRVCNTSELRTACASVTSRHWAGQHIGSDSRICPVCIPLPGLRARLAELPTVGLPRGRVCTWDGGDTACGGAAGRALAVPHIKTFCRYLESDRSLAWFALASHNLSQAAWGKLEKGSAATKPPGSRTALRLSHYRYCSLRYNPTLAASSDPLC